MDWHSIYQGSLADRHGKVLIDIDINDEKGVDIASHIKRCKKSELRTPDGKCKI